LGTNPSKRTKLTAAQRAKKQARNQRRNRTALGVQWAKEHVIEKEKPQFLKPDALRTKQQKAAKAAARAIKKKLPAVEDARGGK
jgi:hypothetical protein